MPVHFDHDHAGFEGDGIVPSSEMTPEEMFYDDVINEQNTDPEHKAVRDAALEQIEKFTRKFVRFLVKLRALPTDCLLFATGFGYMIGCYSQKEIVQRHGGGPETKANVNKYIKSIQREMGMDPVIGQRDKEACRNMKASREKQLRKTNCEH